MTGDGTKTAVFLLNMGGPDSIEAIRPFLENLFRDPEILRFPLSRWLQKPLARWIAARRSVKVAVEYRAMGGQSPLNAITRGQAEALAKILGPGYSVQVAMRYWHPRASEAVKAALAAGAGRAVILPLYPHYSRATTGSSLADLEEALKEAGAKDMRRVIVRSFESFEPYVEALAGCVREGIEAAGGKTTLLFSAHGLPVKLIKEGDPYLRHIETTVAAVMKRFPGVDHRLAFQSRAGPVRWLEPATDDAIRALAAEGVEDVTAVAVSFVSDHIETLREIDDQYRELALGLGIRRFRRAPSLNVRPDFIRALADRVLLAETEFGPP